MKLYVEIIIASLMSVALSGTVYMLDRKTRFGKIDYMKKQVIIGVLFGGLSILGTETGILVKDALINVRDAAPLCAGLIFGGPAGIIAGLMGGIERYFAVYWGAGSFTREACSIATILAGFMAAFLRKFMFDNRKPVWFIGPFVATVTEVFHMLLVFAIHINDASSAFSVVQSCAVPMIVLNSVSVGLSLSAITKLSSAGMRREASQKKLTVIIQRWLLICIIVVFMATSFFTYLFQNRIADIETKTLLTQNLSDVKSNIHDVIDHNLLLTTKKIGDHLDKSPVITQELIDEIATIEGVSEINCVDENGVITCTTNPLFLGYDMREGSQSKVFIALLNGTEELVQKYGPVSYDPSIFRKYAAVRLQSGGFVQVGYDAEKFQRDVYDIVSQEANNRHVGEDGFVIITNHEFDIISGYSRILSSNTSLKKLDADYDVIKGTDFGKIFSLEVNDIPYRCIYDDVESYYVFTLLSEEECKYDRDLTIYISIFMEIMVFSSLFVLIYILIKGMVVDNIVKVNSALGQITDGNLDTIVDVQGNEEFASLSNDINSTVTTLKNYIAEASARIDQELEYARTIQYTSLPHVFPPYPDRKEFEIWAGMATAKEVGGDFYDFYLVKQNKLGFVVADVSGKGIPAALFMMKAKTTIQNLASTGMAINQVFMQSNDYLCENNDAEMFVTAWMGILDTETGQVQFANAGHNDPLVYHKEDGKGFRYEPVRRNLVLAGMDGMPYRLHEMRLSPGDMIFLYTDGVTEATNAHQELYGDERLKNCLNSIVDVESMDVEAISSYVKKDVDAFVGDSPQFDDITMLCLRYTGKNDGTYK